MLRSLHQNTHAGRVRRLVARAAIFGATWWCFGCEPSGDPIIGLGLETSSRPVVDAARALFDSDGIAVRIVFDSLSSGETAGQAVERAEHLLGLDGLIGVVGHSGSRGSLAAAPLYMEDRVPFIVPTATSDRLPGLDEGVFRLVPGNREQGRFITRFLIEVLERRSVTVFYDSDEYGVGLRDGIAAEIAAAGGEVLDQVPIDTHFDVETLVEQTLLRGTPDAVVLATQDEEASEVIAAFSERRPSVPFVAGDGVVLNGTIPSTTPEALHRLYLVRFWGPSISTAVGTRFASRFTTLNGRPPYHTEMKNFEGIMLLAEAIRDGARTPTAAMDFLRGIRAASSSVEGVSGMLSFSGGSPAPLLMVLGATEEVVWDGGR